MYKRLDDILMKLSLELERINCPLENINRIVKQENIKMGQLLKRW